MAKDAFEVMEACARAVIYEGPAEAVPDFTSVMRDKLLLPIDDHHPLESVNGPLMLLSAVMQGALGEGGENG